MSEFSNGPYSIAVEIGNFSDSLLEYLSPELDLDHSSQWQRADYQALDSWFELEWVAKLREVPYEVDGEIRAKLHDTFLAFHTALPFNEAERNWLGEMRECLGEHTHEELPEMIGGLEDEIMVAGVRQVVSGRDLMRRWLAWRRETDEFEGQGALDQARKALQGLKEQLS